MDLVRLYSKILHHFHSIFWTILAQGFVVLSSFVTFKVISSKLGPFEFGQFSLQMAYTSILMILLFNPAQNSLLRFFAEIYKNRNLKIASRFVLAIGSIGIVGSNIIFYFQDYLSLFARGFVPIKYYSMALSAVIFFSFVPISMLQSIRKFRSVAVVQGFDFVIKLIVFLNLFPGVSDSKQALALLILSGLLTFIFGTIVFLLNYRTQIDRPADAVLTISGKDLYRYMAPFIFSGLITWAATFLDRFIVESKLGSQELGLYAATMQIASFPSNFLASVVSQLIVPKVFIASSNGQNNSQVIATFRKEVFLAFLLIWPLLLLYSFFGEKIVGFVSSKEFYIDRVSLVFATFGCLFLQIGNLLGTEGMLYKRAEIYLIPKILHVIVVFLTLVYFTSHFSIHGALFSMFISGIVFCSLIAATNWQVLKSKNM
ncbi:MAG: oligosaccharide flippase family protein [Pseudomonadota bacterium]